MTKRITVLHLGSILVICGMTTGLLTSLSSEVVSTPIEGGTSTSNPNQEAAERYTDGTTGKVRFENEAIIIVVGKK